MTCVPALFLCGCKNDKKQKALIDEIARAKADAIKFKAETVQLKSEISSLNEKLAAANLARDKMQVQLDQVTKDSSKVITSEDSIQQENDKLRKLLAEQLKKNKDMQKQMEMLKDVIRELQARIEPNRTPEHPSIPLEEPNSGP